jgi:alkanesulfonate monooxygenase SsuD/methylene tetrahydromethanopterin reductase-like flavin-dependent oxidoreductase (luciferase family)
MTINVGYLIPTREAVMEGQPQTRPLIELAEQAEQLGFDSVWVGDSLLARPRHEPLSLLAGIATRTERVQLGTAVLLPALRNPVFMAQQIATLDQLAEGRLIIGVGIAGDTPPIRAEFEAADVPFEGRVGRLLESIRLCRALWSGESVDWKGRWEVSDAVLGPMPYRAGGPPVWTGGSHPAALKRAGAIFDGWMPIGPDVPETWTEGWHTVQQHATEAGRAGAVTSSLYATVYIDDDAATANARIDAFLSEYYGVAPEVMRRVQACYGGSAEAVGEWLDGFVRAGVEHLVIRIAGDHSRHLEQIARVRAQFDW